MPDRSRPAASRLVVLLNCHITFCKRRIFSGRLTAGDSFTVPTHPVRRMSGKPQPTVLTKRGSPITPIQACFFSIRPGRQTDGELLGWRCRNHGANRDRKSTRLNSSHTVISYAVFCLKKKNFQAPEITTVETTYNPEPTI